MSETLDRFIAGLSFEPDDYQVKACQDLDDGAGVLVAAPTGAGKTVVGEYATDLALASGLKCFYTTPIKALSNQKFHDLVARHGEDQVGLLTGDVTINSEAPVIVMTTEVLRNMIYRNSHTLDTLGWVVLDEVHYLADRFRGPVWEEVILGLDPRVKIVGLSATVSNAEEFGEWLDEVRGDVRVVVSERRPVPLVQHVAVARRLYELFDSRRPTEVNPELTSIAKEEARFQRDDSRRPRGRSGKGNTVCLMELADSVGPRHSVGGVAVGLVALATSRAVSRWCVPSTRPTSCRPSSSCSPGAGVTLLSASCLTPTWCSLASRKPVSCVASLNAMGKD